MSTSAVQSPPISRVPALAGTVIFHAVLLSVFFVSMVQLPELTVTEHANLALNYGDQQADNPAPTGRATLAGRVVSSEVTAATASPQSATLAAAPTLTAETETTVAVAAGASATPLNAAAIYAGPSPMGLAGASVGDALYLPGWRWLSKPHVADESSATGTLVFEIKVDASGAVRSVVKVAAQSTFADPVAEQLYKDAVFATEFERTEAHHSGGATGRVIFRIGAN